MTRNRIDALDERVRRLCAAANGLDEEHTVVRKRVHALEAAVNGLLDRCSAPTRSRVDSTKSAVEISAHSDKQTPTGRDPSDEATDEEVAAAIRAVEGDLDREADDKCGDDVLAT